MKKTPYLKNFIKLTPEKHAAIAKLYKEGKYTTEHLASTYGVGVRQIQRIAAKFGVLRTAAESNRLMAPLKRYHRLSPEPKVKRTHLTAKLRFEVISGHPSCQTCGAGVSDGIRLEVDHIDNNPSNNDRTNLQVLCGGCNRGKSHLDRWGVTGG